MKRLLAWAWTIGGAAALASACGGKAIVDGKPGGAGGGSTASQGGAQSSIGSTQVSSQIASQAASQNVAIATTVTIADAMPSCGPKPMNCQEACEALWCCSVLPGNCPALMNDPANHMQFVAACTNSCNAQPALIAVVDPMNCKGTVDTIASVNMAYKQICKG